MSTKKSTKLIATGASMALAAGLGVAGLNFTGSANAAEGDVNNYDTTVTFSPAEGTAAQKFVYDSNGHRFRMDLDMGDAWKVKGWVDFLGKTDAKEGATASVNGRDFIWTEKDQILDDGFKPIKNVGSHTAGVWAPAKDGQVDKRYGSIAIASKQTSDIGVGRFLHWDPARNAWVNDNQSKPTARQFANYYHGDFMNIGSKDLCGYKVEAYRDIADNFTYKVDGTYTGDWGPLADSAERQADVSAMAYMFANKDSYPVVKGAMMNAERRSDAILQLAIGTEVVSSAEKAHSGSYIPAIEKAKDLVTNQGFVTPDQALAGKFTVADQGNKDGKTTYLVTLAGVGNAYYPVADDTAATIKFVAKDGKSEAPADVTTTLKDLRKGFTVEVPDGFDATLDFTSAEVNAPGAYLNRAEGTGTAVVTECGVKATAAGHVALAGAEKAVPPSTDPTPTTTSTKPENGNKDNDNKDNGTKDNGTKDNGTKDKVQTPAPKATTKAAVSKKAAPLAKTGASSMLLLLMAAGIATAGSGVVLARREH